MKNLRQHLHLFAALVFLAGLLLPLSSMRGANAAPIGVRSVTLQAGSTDSDADGIPDGGSMPGGIVNHNFVFNVSNQTIGSIRFKYCTTAAPVPALDCNAPTGLSTTATPTTLGASSGATTFTGITNPSANESIVTRASTASLGNLPGTPNDLTIRLDGVKNPTTTNVTFFVRIYTYPSLDGSGTATDLGTVAASTATPIVLTGTMPESLVFCTGATVGTTAGVPDCTTATAGNIAFDQLFSPTATSLATSQMAASTNAGFGYVITVNGPTLTSGLNTINAMASAVSTDVPISPNYGISQFGMNLVANPGTLTPTSPLVGTAIAPVTNGTNYKANPTTNYGTPDQYKYYSGNTVAASDASGAGGSDSQIYTVSYIVNVPGSQPAGGYSTTLTYICTPFF